MRLFPDAIIVPEGQLAADRDAFIAWIESQWGGFIEKELFRDGFVLRYDIGVTEDGLPPGEGAFLACSFWLVDNYVLQERYDEARDLYERLLSLRNDVGLLAEEYDPRGKRQLGNFPQAFSHIGLINSARNLSAVAPPVVAERASRAPGADD